ncbi:MAG: hypothetical protein NXI23_10635 [Bacteroidetes bacterium]|jgi:hypothetical protein|nr:hypothetical protein [Bacteroidota bacterium]MDF1864128.1 hypothetical protein [Saprospiraceae bacterium]
MSTSNKGLTSEDFVIIAVMAFGFFGGLIAQKMDYQPIIVSILFGTGIASLVYRFLGGIQDSTSFNLGPVKIVGALAALIGTAWVIDFKLEKQVQPIEQLSIMPPINEWFGMKKDGSPVAVSVNEATIDPPTQGLEENRLSLKYEDDQIKVFDRDNADFLFGYFGMSEFKNFDKGALFNAFPNKVSDFTVTKELSPEDAPLDLSRDNIPFKINVTSFENNKSYFKLLSSSDNSVLYTGNITTRGAEIVEINGRFYFISIFSVNHQGKEKKHYAKFLVGELSPKLNLE